MEIFQVSKWQPPNMEETGFFISFYSLAAFGNRRRKIAFQLYRSSDYTGCSFLVSGNY
jgi:hypothetical protein